MRTDILKFIDKYGLETYEIFTKYKDRVKNLGLSTDITYHIAHTDIDKMKSIIKYITNYFTPTHRRDIEIAKKLAKYKYYGEDKGYKAYQLFNGYASFLLAPHTTWCISGSLKALTQNDMKLDLARGFFLGEITTSGYKQPLYKMYLFVNETTQERYLLRFLKETKTLELWKYDNAKYDIPLIDELPYHLLPPFKNMNKEQVYNYFHDFNIDKQIDRFNRMSELKEKALKEGKRIDYYL